MHVALRRVTRRIDDFQGVVHLPYATEKFEPVDLEGEVQLVPTSAYDTDGFRHAFGVPRSQVFGEEQFADFMGDGYRPARDELFQMTQDFFAEHFFAPAPIAGRRIYFCFNESVHVMLKRLVAAARTLEARAKVDSVCEGQEARGIRSINDREAGSSVVDTVKENAGLHRSPLEGVVVVAIPFGDDAANPAPGVDAFSAAAYKQAYEKYELVLDATESAQILEHRAFVANSQSLPWR